MYIHKKIVKDIVIYIFFVGLIEKGIEFKKKDGGTG
jgi:hypothetical protein